MNDDALSAVALGGIVKNQPKPKPIVKAPIAGATGVIEGEISAIDKIIAGKGTSVNKPLDKAALEAQHGKGNVTQGGGNSLQNKETVTGNIANS